MIYLKQCPHCKTEYSDNEMYCPKDNYRLTKISNQNNLMGVTGTTKLVCPRCKNQYDTSVEKCPKCDLYLTSIKNNQNPNVNNNTPKQFDSKNIPKCPTCGSTNVHPISSGKKTLGFITVGVFSSSFGKSYECDDCKYKW